MLALNRWVYMVRCSLLIFMMSVNGGVSPGGVPNEAHSFLSSRLAAGKCFLNIIHLNARSIPSHIDELRDVLISQR
jgi:hypothetical protein